MDAAPSPPQLPTADGLGRLPFLVIVLILAGICGLLTRTNEPYVVFVIVGWMIVLVVLAAFRLKNIGWSAAFCLVGLVPYLNALFAFALAVLPPRFATTRKLDSAGRVIATLLILGSLLLWWASNYFLPN